MEVMTIGRIRMWAARNRGVEGALALGLELARELDDQDGVLRRQADGREQTHHEVHVVRHVEGGRRGERAEHAKGTP